MPTSIPYRYNIFLRGDGIYCMSKLLIDSETGELLNEYGIIYIDYIFLYAEFERNYNGI